MKNRYNRYVHTTKFRYLPLKSQHFIQNETGKFFDNLSETDETHQILKHKQTFIDLLLISQIK